MTLKEISRRNEEIMNNEVTCISKYDNEVVHLDKFEDKDHYNISGIKIEL